MNEEQLDAFAEFSAGAGHEINNPLAIINGHVQLLLSQIQDPQQRRSLAVIASQVRRAYEMIADIRLFARPPKPQLESFDLIANVQNLLDKQREELQERSIEIVFQTEKESLEVCCDPVQLAVVLSALIRNSAEAIVEKGSVTVAVFHRTATEEV